MLTLLSFAYKRVRFYVIRWKADLEEAIIFGDKVLHWLYPKCRFLFSFPIPKELETTLYELRFASPLTIASFKDDWTIFRMWLDMGMGGGTFKTILAHPRIGNKRPRIHEFMIDGQPAFINAIGLPGKGIPGLISYLQKHGFKLFGWYRIIVGSILLILVLLGYLK